MLRLIIAFLSIFALAGAIRTASAEDTLKIAETAEGGLGTPGFPRSASAGASSRSMVSISISSIPAAGPELIQAMIAGSIDISVSAGISAAIGTFAKGAPIPHYFQRNDRRTRPLLVCAGGFPNHTIEDMNGKTVAFSAIGSSSHGSLLALIAQYHLTAKPTPTGNIASTITQTMTRGTTSVLAPRLSVSISSRVARRGSSPPATMLMC